ncbi:hypothetical protein [Phyllobacterium zundukense]|uniref:DUF1640 domain-containing protein n=1 Tax=Phyllobacterium zundukense TaxID=1867719 RepID=A0A2N9VVS0_9HYPH|nr:hypothetical protein [Phyllobacterium zundukense]ATU91323.1 hypothetical protein BLM14_06490 [Phyllobacterium zundukense]PIO43588.1 hypothetical protein B5P45_16875 [Phyllobacterium zundukense]
MTISFDTLGYALRLEQGGFSPAHAKVQAEAARDFIMPELVTKSDLNTALELLTLRLTVRMGAFFFGTSVATIAAIAAIVKLFP